MSGGPPERPVLVVDLDGTLTRTDLLWESFWGSLRTRSAPSAGPGAAGGSIRARIKSFLAGRSPIDPASLPYNEAVLEIIRAWRRDGGRTVLATAADTRYAEAVAAHLGLFDEVHGSDGVRNLKGRAKAAFLAERFGPGGYDYVGDARADLPVWKSARRAVTVGASGALRRAVEAIHGDVRHLDGGQGGARELVRALRPHQWSKNLLVLLPVLMNHSLSLETWAAALLALVAFSLVASSAYLVNDMIDLADDRSHPRKRHRPVASGTVTPSTATLTAAALLAGGLLCGLAVGRPEFLGMILGYYALTLSYSAVLKRRLVIDIIALAALYTMRVIAGGAATAVPLSVWLLAFSMFLFLSLAAVKRQAELVDAVASGRDGAGGRAYRSGDLPVISMMAIASGYVAVLVVVLYLDSPDVQRLYNHVEVLWGIVPVLLYWVSRIVMIAHRGHMHDDPIVFAWRDHMSLVCGLIIALLVVAGALW